MAVIAVVDDNAPFRATVAEMLSGTGHYVVLFDGGAEALASFEEAPVDLVISDIFMPGMNGFQFIERLREVLPSVPIIAVSGGGQFLGQSVIGDAKQFGATMELAKPFRRDQLLSMIKRALA
jgi:CheY-like chemotaxis protein